MQEDCFELHMMHQNKKQEGINSMRGVQKVCGPTLKEKRYKGHSMYENTTSQYMNIYQEKSFQIYLLSLHALLEVAYPKTLKNLN